MSRHPLPPSGYTAPENRESGLASCTTPHEHPAPTTSPGLPLATHEPPRYLYPAYHGYDPISASRSWGVSSEVRGTFESHTADRRRSLSLEQYSYRTHHGAQRASQTVIQERSSSRPFSDFNHDDSYSVTSSYGMLASRRGSEASERRVVDVDSQ